ncbi:MAG: glycosyltransferase family 4 protein [Candidatus Humimicrobiaceae bacterium]
MKKLNILYVTEYFPPYVKGGSEISTSLIVKEVSKYHNCYILTGNFQKKPWLFGTSTVFPFLKRYEIKEKNLTNIIKNEVKYYLNIHINKKILQNLIDKKKIDVIHIIPTGYYAFPILKSVLNSNKPIIIDNRDAYLACPISFLRKCKKNFFFDFQCIKCVSENYSIDLGFLRFLKIIFSTYELLKFKIMKDVILKKINKNNSIIMVSLSNYVKNQLIEAGYPTNKLVVIHNICDIKILDNKICKRENRIVFAGILEKSKGIWDAIKAFELLNDKDLYFDIAGDGRELDSIKKYISDNKIKNINLLGWVDHNQVTKLYLKSKIIIAPSVWPEPFGRFTLDSMTTKTPIVSTTAGGIPEGIRDQETGLLVEPNNPQQLAEAIKKLLTNKKLYEKISKNLPKEAEKYSPEVIGNQRIALYKEILKKNN